MEKSFIFDAVNVGGKWDRQYFAKDYADYFSTFISNGVFPNPSTNLQVVANDDMTVTLKAGKAFINGRYYHNTDNLELEIDVADGVLDRVDSVVIQCRDLIDDGRKIIAVVKRGKFSSNPVRPQLTRNADIYELQVATIRVNHGAVKIMQSDITDTRLNKNVCGIVTQTVETVDTTTLYDQIQADLEHFRTVEEVSFKGWKDAEQSNFKEWRDTEQASCGQWRDTEKADFEQWQSIEKADYIEWLKTIKDILDEETAGHLLNLINTKANKKVPATAGNIAILDKTGNLEDSGKQLNNFATNSHTHSANEIGTYSKEELLTSEVCEFLGIPTTSVPNDAFFVLSIGNNRALVEVTAYETGTTTPIANVLIDGILTATGDEIFTDNEGKAIGFTTTAVTTIGVNSEYEDLNTSTSQVQTPLGKLTEVTIYSTRISHTTSKIITTSGVRLRFTDKALVDVHLSGAGYNGNDYVGEYEGGNGGSGGYQNYDINLKLNPRQTYTSIVGASNGGSSSMFGLSSYKFSGGAGGTRNSMDGKDCTVRQYGTGSVVAGGGGGKGLVPNARYGLGGSPYGGRGALNTQDPVNVNRSKGYGGGGGGGISGGRFDSDIPGGKGYQGAIWYRWRLA